jgi:DNA-binding NarL/FixJ family response regulator
MSANLTNGETASTILAVDDHPLAREALARLAADLGPGTEVLEADSLAAAQEYLAAHADLALVVLDIALPDAEGVEAVERLLEARPDLPVLVLTSKDDPATARAILDAGARGFISKRSPTRVLVEAIRLVLVGGTYVPREALHAGPETRRDPGPAAADPRAAGSLPREALSLTPRQLDVLALLVQGKPNKLICRTLNLAEGTVKTHTAAIYRALNVMNRTQAVYAASRLGLQLAPSHGPGMPAEPPPAMPGTAANDPMSRAAFRPDWRRAYAGA